MTLEAGKEMDRRCVIDWLNEVYVTPSRAFDEYTEDELKMFAHDALVLLKEQHKIVRCEDCKHRPTYPEAYGAEINGRWCYWCELLRAWRPDDWFCAYGERQ